MAKTTSVILGLAFLAMGILGITGIMPMFTSEMIYVNIGEIVLGALGLIVGIYARQSTENDTQRQEINQQRQENNKQRQESYDQQKQEISQQKQENDQQRKENYDLQKQENERLRKEVI